MGRWRKQTLSPGAVQYPLELEFRAAGTYLAKADPGAFCLWQSGDYEIDGASQIRIQAANDAMLPYQVSADDPETLSFVDPQGCEFTYRRMA